MKTLTLPPMEQGGRFFLKDALMVPLLPWDDLIFPQMTYVIRKFEQYEFKIRKITYPKLGTHFSHFGLIDISHSLAKVEFTVLLGLDSFHF